MNDRRDVIDENTALEKIRTIARLHRTTQRLEKSDVDDLCHWVGVLDDWLAAGNTLPARWHRATRPT